MRLDLLTGRDKGAERAEKLRGLAAGDTAILVGTHALFQKDVAFRDLRLAIVDEQHRFGVRQRMDLGAKGAAADILVMTATPIPRSLALASYGDMDLSVLDEKPPGRTPVETALVSSGRVPEVDRAPAQGASPRAARPTGSARWSPSPRPPNRPPPRSASSRSASPSAPTSSASSTASSRRPPRTRRWPTSPPAAPGCWSPPR